MQTFTLLKAGAYNLELRLAGTNTVVASLPGVSLTGGKVYTAFSNGFAGGTFKKAVGITIIANY